jgi:hypothetical protein
LGRLHNNAHFWLSLAWPDENEEKNKVIKVIGYSGCMWWVEKKILGCVFGLAAFYMPCEADM